VERPTARVRHRHGLHVLCHLRGRCRPAGHGVGEVRGLRRHATISSSRRTRCDNDENLARNDNDEEEGDGEGRKRNDQALAITYRGQRRQYTSFGSFGSKIVLLLLYCVWSLFQLIHFVVGISFTSLITFTPLFKPGAALLSEPYFFLSSRECFPPFVVRVTPHISPSASVKHLRKRRPLLTTTHKEENKLR